jgi:molecular chaperone HscC
VIVGIDLGTTNSLVAVFRDGAPQLIPNALGHVLTPSAVSVTDAGEVLVGLPARERIATHPERTATAFKRWMGTDHSVRLGGRAFRPEELSSLVLRALKHDAEAYLGEPVHEAVITVPAYFNEAQRKATKTAGELAGLKVDRLLNEPTAAGLAYGLREKPDHTVFLIVDLGGGTFDVSVVEYFEGVVEVRASAGDTRLGGEDFVRVLTEAMLERADGLSDKEKDELRRRNALWRAAEQLKRDLTDHETAVGRFKAGADAQARELEVTLSRKQFEERAADLLHRLRRPIERALSDARLDPSQLAEVVLVGGATRMPMVRQMVTRLFQRLPLRLINPDETVARGAAVQAALKSRDAAVGEVVLTDVMPYSLGVVTTQKVGDRHVSDCFSPIIERNTPVPVSREDTFSTIADNQTRVELDIRQGESPVGSENLQIAKLEVPVPARAAGTVAIEVRFTYDPNGLLEIDVHERGSGRKLNEVVQHGGNPMTPEQIADARKRMAALKIHPRELTENRYVVERAKRLYEDRLGDVRAAIARCLAVFEAALNNQEPRQIDATREQLKRLLDEIDQGFVL